MGRTTKRLNLRAQWEIEFDFYLAGHGCFLSKPAHLAMTGAKILKDLPGPVDMRRRAG